MDNPDQFSAPLSRNLSSSYHLLRGVSHFCEYQSTLDGGFYCGF
ncbi:Uncharacterized protein APZ42_014154 [Daphnia magna]|uniref:Uncharacterized protein n=1 Tax=Daphnia magna TaxID=35525 RepID=A0A162Q0C1_9CRUS|nr:Uncharacterized protein APZ42_014154 [Daphnia magna]